jgi:hypothetical protein
MQGYATITPQTPHPQISSCLTPPSAPFPSFRHRSCDVQESAVISRELLIPTFNEDSPRNPRQIFLNPRLNSLQIQLTQALGPSGSEGLVPECSPELEESFDLSDDEKESHSTDDAIDSEPVWSCFFPEDSLGDELLPAVRILPRRSDEFNP